MEELGTLTESAANAAQALGADIPTWFVVVIGLGIVFVGLICLIALITIMGRIMQKIAPAEKAPSPEAAAAPAPQEIPNRGELVAAVSAALAEEMGKDVRAIRIVSIKRV